jgi:menaquinol-cytochrome c reductase iron-sulfur subunit
VADELDRPDERPAPHGAEPDHPSPSIWPFAFAGGLALVLVGLIVSWPVAAIGAVIAVVFGFLWIRDVTSDVRRVPVEEPAPPPVSELAEPEEPVEAERYPRDRFLEGATLGIGALIGGVVTLPALGFMVAPAFVGQKYDPVDLGPLDNYPQDQFFIAKFFSRKGEGTVGKRTAFVRSNGMVNGVPSFTIISNRCVHLGCPTQPQGPPEDAREIKTSSGAIELTPTQVSGFSCPCHGGAYDQEGNRTAGPPVRALDRYEYSIRDGSLWLEKPYSVAKVKGQGAEAKMEAYRLADPGQHVDGPEQVFYPFVP